MLRRMWLCHSILSVCLSVRPSVCNVQVPYRDHIGWNSSKIISRPNSLRPLLGLTPTWAIWCTFIRSITTTVINNFGKISRGRSQGLSKFFRASTHRAHRAVIFVIAGLSCITMPKGHRYKTERIASAYRTIV